MTGESADPGGGVRYTDVEAGYFERRALRRHARVGSLWALGVGAVISGDFFGWNFGIAAGGFGGLLLATVIITVLYAGLCFSVAEMTAALPHTGGAYSFARSAMGPWGAYVTGLAENMEYILTPAVIVVGIGGYLGAIFGTPDAWAPLWWLAAYALFVGLNVAGVEVTFRFTVFITLLALAILAVFWIGALPHVDFATFAFDVEPAPGGNAFLPFGWKGVFAALPFAIWFYLAIEQLPLAAEEAHAPQQDLPLGILLGLGTLVVCAFLTLTLSVGIAPGAAALGASDEPLRRRHRREVAGIAGGGGPRRQLPHDHLRLRAPDILAGSRGLFPHLAVNHPWHTADATRGARGRGRAGLRRGVRHPLARFKPSGGCGAAQHGRLRRPDLVHVADPVIRAAAPAHAPNRASVPQPAGDPGRGGGVRYLGRNSRGTLRGGPDLPERRDRCGVVVRGGLAVVRKRGPAPARLLARRALRGGGVESGAALN